MTTNNIQSKVEIITLEANSSPIIKTTGSAGSDILLSNIVALYRFGSFKLSDKKITKLNQKIKEGKAITLYPFDRIIVGSGFKMNLPENTYCSIVSRSGLSAKQGLIVTNAPGIIDSDYKDEIKVILTNTSFGLTKLTKSQGIAQFLINQSTICELEGVEKLDNIREGGFGSTDLIENDEEVELELELDDELETELDTDSNLKEYSKDELELPIDSSMYEDTIEKIVEEVYIEEPLEVVGTEDVRSTNEGIYKSTVEDTVTSFNVEPLKELAEQFKYISSIADEHN